jgi:non-canonical (house-cleaning) NTP pyrophosphatase
MKLRRADWVLFIVIVTVGMLCAQQIAIAQTAYPMLMSTKPVAVQVGTTAEATVSSRYSLAGAYQVLVSGQGVKAEVESRDAKSGDAKKPLEKVKVKFTAAKDAQPGVRDFRIATPTGVSTVGQLVVVRDPVVVEAAGNDTVEKAQEIALPAVVCGAIEKNEDVDYFRFHAGAGEVVTFRCRCARLEDRIHDLQTHADPIMTLRRADGSTLALAENRHYLADPSLAYRFDHAGDYLLEVRDIRYQGNQYWEYCLEISGRPLVETVYPLAVAAKQTESLELVGELAGGEPMTRWSVPALTPVIHAAELPLVSGVTNPVSVIVADLPLVRESDAANDILPGAQLVTVPSGINGRIDREGDVDCFAFNAKKGEAFSVEVVARRAQSALDATLRILDEKGKQLVLNDDLRLGKRNHADSWIENWVAPADGKYTIEIRDVHLRGGAMYPYFIKLTRSEPYFELYLDSDKTLVTPGGSAALFVRIERKNGFTGEVQLSVDGLPSGVAASCGRILADKGQDGCIILQADGDANLQVANLRITGAAVNKTAADSSQSLTALATSYQETYLPGGGRGHWPVATHTLAIADPADIRGVSLSTYDVTLKPGESKKIEVTIDRAPGVNVNVTLDMLMRHLNTTYANTLPPGVTLNDKDAKSLLSGDATQGYLTLTAAKDAPACDEQQCVVVAHVALNFVMKWTYASRPVTVRVIPSK